MPVSLSDQSSHYCLVRSVECLLSSSLFRALDMVPWCSGKRNLNWVDNVLACNDS